MRTTVTLDPDVAAEVERIRRERGGGLSAVLNELARLGIAHRQRQGPKFVQRTSTGRARLDVSNIGEVLDLLDEPPR